MSVIDFSSKIIDFVLEANKNPYVHKILQYCKSHIYELHSIVAGAITFLIMQFAKRPIKKYSAQKYGFDEGNAKRKRFNTIIMLITMVVGMFSFALVAYVSPLVYYKQFTATMTGTQIITFYVICEKLGIIKTSYYKYHSKKQEVEA